MIGSGHPAGLGFSGLSSPSSSIASEGSSPEPPSINKPPVPSYSGSTPKHCPGVGEAGTAVGTE